MYIYIYIDTHTCIAYRHKRLYIVHVHACSHARSCIPTQEPHKQVHMPKRATDNGGKRVQSVNWCGALSLLASFLAVLFDISPDGVKYWLTAKIQRTPHRSCHTSRPSLCCSFCTSTCVSCLMTSRTLA